MFQDSQAWTCERMEGKKFKTIIGEKNFEDYNFMGVSNFWDKSVNSKFGPSIPLERFWNTNVKSEFAFLFGVLN